MFPFCSRSRSARVAKPRHSQTNAAQWRPAVEMLEGRTLLSTYSVLNTGDTGVGSLRQALTDANAHPGPDVSDLQGIPGTTNLPSALPALVDNVDIIGPGAKVLTVQRYPLSLAKFRIFTVSAGVDAQISGLTIANGWSTLGGGIY